MDLALAYHQVDAAQDVGAVGLGLLQVLALLPGVSRTGITITVARILGWERQAAARFSLLLAMPLMLGHAGRTFWALSHKTALIVSTDLVLTALASGLGSLLAVAAMMAWVERNSYAPLAVVRILFGLGAVGLILLGWCTAAG